MEVRVLPLGIFNYVCVIKIPRVHVSSLTLGHTKLITCFSDSLATNVDPGGGNKKKKNK